MWYVYHHEDSWECGWTVESEEKAENYCKENTEYCYVYVS